jgi:hypothetical protein
VLAIAVTVGATCAVARCAQFVWRTVTEAAHDRKALFHVAAVISMDNELLVLLDRGGACASSLWLHARMSVNAVVLLARWHDLHMPIQIVEDELFTVLRPTAAHTSLRFDRQSVGAEVEVLQN